MHKEKCTHRPTFSFFSSDTVSRLFNLIDLFSSFGDRNSFALLWFAGNTARQSNTITNNPRLCRSIHAPQLPDFPNMRRVRASVSLYILPVGFCLTSASPFSHDLDLSVVVSQPSVSRLVFQSCYKHASLRLIDRSRAWTPLHRKMPSPKGTWPFRRCRARKGLGPSFRASPSPFRPR